MYYLNVLEECRKYLLSIRKHLANRIYNVSVYVLFNKSCLIIKYCGHLKEQVAKI